MASSQTDISRSLNVIASKHDMSVVSVSWEDCTRGYSPNGQLSCYGSNITDVRIIDEKKQPIFTLRHQNYNEKLGLVSTDKVAVVVGNHEPTSHKELTSITLKTYLEQLDKYAGYANIERGVKLSNDKTDNVVSVRFQTVFIAPESQFAVNVYSYATQRDSDPQNMMLLATAQGTSIQQTTAKPSNHFIHMNNENVVTSKLWMQAHSSTFGVGSEQKETKETLEAAASKGHATAQRMGIEAMGTRFNNVMMIQIPLKQKEVSQSRGLFTPQYQQAAMSMSFGSAAIPKSMSMSKSVVEEESESEEDMGCDLFDDSSSSRKRKSCGQSSAARISAGSVFEEKWQGLTCTSPLRHDTQRITITMTQYYVVEGGVPAAKDIELAIADLESLYDACDIPLRLEHGNKVDGLTSPLPVSGGFSFGTINASDKPFPK